MVATTCFSQGYRQVHPKFHLGRLRPPKRMFQRSIMTNIQYSEQLKFICGKTVRVSRQLDDDDRQIYVCRGKPRQKATSITL